MRLNRTLAGVAAAGVLAAMVVASPASADTNVGSGTTLAGMGSDTSQDVMEGLSSAVKIGGSPVLSNYKAQPVGRTVTTRTGNANCTFTVAKNSGEGRDSLSAAMRAAGFAGSPATGGTAVTSTNMTNCVNFARSSSGGNPTTSPGVGTMTYVPFATDSVTYATLNISSVPHTLNLADLKAIYTASGTPGSAACLGMEPLLPAFGSGTRSFFVANILGLSDTVIPAPAGTAAPLGTCVRDTDATGTAIQEHVGSFLTKGTQLVPFSTAQYITQNAGTLIPSQLGRAALGAIDWSNTNGANYASPIALQTSFGSGTRPLYNVVATQSINNGFAPPAGSSTQTIPFSQNAYDTFVGPFNPDGTANAAHQSLICQQSALIAQYGLAPWAACGDTGKRNTN